VVLTAGVASVVLTADVASVLPATGGASVLPAAGAAATRAVQPAHDPSLARRNSGFLSKLGRA
jgi:hypothetical protein